MERGAQAHPVGAVRRLALAGAAAAAVLVAAVLLIAHGSSRSGVAAVRPIAVRASFEPAAVEFGDTVTARVDVLVDPAAVRAGSVHVGVDLAPLTTLSGTSTQTTHGRVDAITVSVRAACLTGPCVARSGATAITAPRTTVAYRTRAGRSKTVSTAFAPLTVRSRVTAADLAPTQPPFEVDDTPGAIDYRIAPGTAALVLEILAVCAALGAVALVVLQLRVVLLRRATAVTGGEVERALRLVRQSQERSEPDRRRALGLLARLLPDRALGGAASELAWSEPKPGRDEIAGLVSQVEREGES